MQFSNTTTKAGIIQQIEFRINIGDTGISGDATLLAQITGQINDYYMRAAGLIIGADGTWKWDDSNQANQAVATTNINSGQADYNIMAASPSSDQDWLQVERINISDSSGNIVTLRNRDRRQFNQPRTEREKTGGTPTSFDFDGSSVFLDPEPNYDSTNGLEVVFKRSPIEFTTSDTTKRPGFATTFHEYLVLGPTYIWEKYKNVGNPEQTMRDIVTMEKRMQEFYGHRDKTVPVKIGRGTNRRGTFK